MSGNSGDHHVEKCHKGNGEKDEIGYEHEHKHGHVYGNRCERK